MGWPEYIPLGPNVQTKRIEGTKRKKLERPGCPIFLVKFKCVFRADLRRIWDTLLSTE